MASIISLARNASSMARRPLFTMHKSRNIFGSGGIPSCFDITEEVADALATHRPIVALESTIITHGMPFPKNHQCAVSVEKVVRDQGAIPATIAIVGGRVKIGLAENDLEMLADTERSPSVKTSRRDFPYVVGNRLNGGTTVSGTILVANKVGIPIFVTGGIGGVHRNGENTLDISADLTELGRNPIAVISSGVKSILDIPKTLEYLETQGVFVATFGENDDFPAFYSRKSGSKSPYCLKSFREAAQVIKTHLELGMSSGMLIGVPIPEQYSIDIEDTIQKALEEADKHSVKGKEVTPFILARVAAITGGKSLESMQNNAMVGAKIAVEMCKLGKERKERSSGNSPSDREGDVPSLPVIIGGSIVDCSARLHEPTVKVNRIVNPVLPKNTKAKF